jgi:hypothetical protein
MWRVASSALSEWAGVVVVGGLSSLAAFPLSRRPPKQHKAIHCLPLLDSTITERESEAFEMGHLASFRNRQERTRLVFESNDGPEQDVLIQPAIYYVSKVYDDDSRTATSVCPSPMFYHSARSKRPCQSCPFFAPTTLTHPSVTRFKLRKNRPLPATLGQLAQDPWS